MNCTIPTPKYRIHIHVFDFSGEHAKYAGADLAGKVHFAASVLPSSAHPSTSYRGTCIYHGESLAAALVAAQCKTGIGADKLKSMLPRKFDKYWKVAA